MILVDLRDSSLDNLKNENIKMFPEINYSKQFLRKMIIKIEHFFTTCPQSIKKKKKDEDYMQVANKENLSSCAPS